MAAPPLRAGTLYVCGTPIGNLADLSPRALETLRGVDVIAAEDTRQIAKIKERFGIDTPTVSYHAHNADTQGPRLIERLQSGEAIALVSDAGMPGISDPGEELVQAAIKADVAVIPVPGPVAAITGLVVSGLPTNRWVFEGFLPREGKARRRLLRTLAREARTLVFYESPHRLTETLADLAGAFGGDRPAAAARELTKAFEEVVRGSLADLVAHFQIHAPRGEFTLVVGGTGVQPVDGETADIDARLRDLLEQGLSKQDASRQLAKELGLPRRTLYQRALVLSEDA